LLKDKTYSKALIYDIIHLLNPLVDSKHEVDDELVKTLILVIMKRKRISNCDQLIDWFESQGQFVPVGKLYFQ